MKKQFYFFVKYEMVFFKKNITKWEHLEVAGKKVGLNFGSKPIMKEKQKSFLKI